MAHLMFVLIKVSITQMRAHITMLIIGLVASISICLAKDARGSGIEIYKQIEQQEALAYQCYFNGNAKNAEAALNAYISYLNQLPNDKSAQVSRYSGLTHAFTRLQFIHAYIDKTPMDFAPAVDAFEAMEKLGGVEKIDRVHVARKLIRMVQITDGPRVPWANSELIKQAEASLDNLSPDTRAGTKQ